MYSSHRLSASSTTHVILEMVWSNPPIAITFPKVGGTQGNDALLRLLLGPTMNCNEHEMLIKFLKLKPPMFHGFESEDSFEFILDFYERLLKLGIVHQHAG